jgi:probable H4MPT-linked C1 transfer pathway protein
LSVIGLDIGGANLKAAHSDGTAIARRFQLWKQPSALAAELSRLADELPRARSLAITMTGELCDCFRFRSDGVLAILAEVDKAFPDQRVLIWTIDGCFVGHDEAQAHPLRVAAANWLALGEYVSSRWALDSGIVIDVGTTTTDILFCQAGKAMPRARTDYERLATGELVYTGVERTPLCAILAGRVASELFATTLDVYLVLGHIKEDMTNEKTANARPATRAEAYHRLARMLCADCQSVSTQELDGFAGRIMRAQVDLVRAAVRSVAATIQERPNRFIICGSGEFLAEAALDNDEFRGVTRHSLAGELGRALSEAACAYAVAKLAERRED